VDHADHAGAAELVQRVVACGGDGFGGVPAAPVHAHELAAELERGPSGRIDEAHAPEELAARARLDRPHAVAAQLPMRTHAGYRAARLAARERLARADEAHDLGIGAHRGVGVDVGGVEGAQQQPRGLEDRGKDEGHALTLPACRA